MNLEIFKNDNFEIRVVVGEAGDPLFCLADVCKILNIEMPVFDEANALWLKRMTEDKTFMVSMKYAEYFGQAGQNNKFLNFKNGNDNSSDDKNKFLKRLENDEEFYYELM